MKRSKIVCLMIIAVFCFLTYSVSSFAQQAGTSAGASGAVSASGNTQGASVHQQGNMSSGTNVQAGNSSAGASENSDTAVAMSPVPAELVTKLDTKTAKVGDAVEAKTTKTVTTAQGLVIRKGSKLLGTVTQSQAHAKGESESRLGIKFDRVQLRNGEEVAVRSTIDSLSRSSVLDASSGVDDMMSTGPVLGGGAAPGRSALGGGSGLVRGAVGGAGNTLGQAGRGVGDVARTTGSEAGEATEGVANHASGSVYGAAQQGTGMAAHATSLPGVMLSSSASSVASGTLSAKGRNIHLDNGTQMMMHVVAVK